MAKNHPTTDNSRSGNFQKRAAANLHTFKGRLSSPGEATTSEPDLSAAQGEGPAAREASASANMDSSPVENFKEQASKLSQKVSEWVDPGVVADQAKEKLSAAQRRVTKTIKDHPKTSAAAALAVVGVGSAVVASRLLKSEQKKNIARPVKKAVKAVEKTAKSVVGKLKKQVSSQTLGQSLPKIGKSATAKALVRAAKPLKGIKFAKRAAKSLVASTTAGLKAKASKKTAALTSSGKASQLKKSKKV